jgi:pyridine nucleotide-disulfide oxidoreductase
MRVCRADEYRHEWRLGCPTIMAMTFGVDPPRVLFEHLLPCPCETGTDVLGIATLFKNSPAHKLYPVLGWRGSWLRNPSGKKMSTVLTKCFPPEKSTVANAARRQKRVLIIGAGFAGIAAASALKRADVEVLLVDRRNHHIFQPLLY